MATLQEAVSEIAVVVGSLEGIRRSWDEAPDQINAWPAVVVIPAEGEHRMGPAGSYTGLHNIVVELHVPRRDLPRDWAAAMTYAKAVPAAIYEALRDGLLPAIDRIGRIRYQFGQLTWGGQPTFGWQFTLESVKTIDDLATAGAQTFNEANGYIVFEFADGHQSARLLCYGSLLKKGMSGVMFMPTHLLDGAARLRSADVEFLDAAGWDICSHGYGAGLISAMDDGELEEHLAFSKATLQGLGVERGVRVYGPPQGIMVAREYARASKYYDWIRLSTGQALFQMPFDDQLTYTTQAGDDATALATVKATMAGVVNAPDQVVVLTFHDVVKGTAVDPETSMTRLEALRDYAVTIGANVVTYSDLIDRLVPAYREFGDGFEGNSFAAWDSTTGSPTVTSAAALHGSYGMQCTAAGQYVTHGFTEMGRVNLRLYVNPDGLTATDGAVVIIARLRDGATAVGWLRLIYTSAHGWRAYADLLDDAGAYQETAKGVLSGATCLETHWDYAADGAVLLWIDEGNRDSTEDLVGGTRKPDSVQVGWYSSSGTVTGVLYLDDVVVDKQDYIGIKS